MMFWWRQCRSMITSCQALLCPCKFFRIKFILFLLFLLLFEDLLVIIIKRLQMFQKLRSLPVRISLSHVANLILVLVYSSHYFLNLLCIYLRQLQQRVFLIEASNSYSSIKVPITSDVERILVVLMMWAIIFLLLAGICF